MMSIIKKVNQWGKRFGTKHKWFSFVASIIFVGLALFRIGINDILGYAMLAPLIILGVLIVITYPSKVK